METAVCSKCGETKSLSEFNRDKSKQSGYRSQCRMCQRGSDKRRRQNKSVQVRRLKLQDQAAEEKKRLRAVAYREACLRLIDRHRTEFDALVYSESVRAGIINVDDRPRERWVTLA